MDLNRAKSVLAAIREEARRRDDAERDHYWAYEQGLNDEAFINEFCLIFLVALRHHLEGELVCLAARVGGAGTGITQAQFQQGIERLSTKRENRLARGKSFIENRQANQTSSDRGIAAAGK